MYKRQYLAHTACDNNNFILDFHITSGNIHDSVAFSDLYQKIKNNSKQHTTAIAIDAGYITPYTVSYTHLDVYKRQILMYYKLYGLWISYNLKI